jgi:hypothetical protein
VPGKFAFPWRKLHAARGFAEISDIADFYGLAHLIQA